MGMIKYYDNPDIMLEYDELSKQIILEKFNWVNILKNLDKKINDLLFEKNLL